MITIKLTDEEAYQLSVLLNESKDTGNDEWDIIMDNVYNKLAEKLI